MSDTDSLDYLQNDFDPTTLTVPRLRSILVSYDISYPSAAKKAQLIEIFTDRVLPRRNKILRDRDHARRSSRGITNANSYSTEKVQNEPNVSLPSRTPRKLDRISSTKIVAQEVEELPPIRERTQSPTKKKSRASSKHARTSDTETGIDLDNRRRSSRKTRKSRSPSNQPSEALGAKFEVVDDGAGVKIVKRRESAFTYDNPFQSGSSPTGPLTPEKRRSLGASVIRERRKASGHKPRRRSDMPQVNDGIYPPSRPTFEAPKAAISQKDVYENAVEAGEEFTPEEQLELSRERASKTAKSHSAFSQKAKTHTSFNLQRPLWVVVITLICGYAAWYRQERIAVGFCGVGRNSSPFHSTWPIPDWTRIFLEPQCEPCPQHAYCSGGMQIECEHDYLLKLHPLSLGGLVPLAPTCEADGIKARRVSIVATRAVEELRERRAKFECGDLKDEESSAISSVEIDADDLKKEISKNRGKTLSEAEFEDLWAGALAETLRRDEVLSQTDGIYTNLSSTSLARLPLSCALRRSIRNTLAEHRFQIGGIITTLLLLLYVRSIYHSWQQTNAAIPHLVSLTLERLAHQAALYEQGVDTNRWISIGQLRDDVLRDEHSITKRESLWRKVRTVIETNANVRSSQKEDRNGEVSRVWEWIGIVNTLEGSVRRRQSNRVNRSEADGSSPMSANKSSSTRETLNYLNENRPVY